MTIALPDDVRLRARRPALAFVTAAAVVYTLSVAGWYLSHRIFYPQNVVASLVATLGLAILSSYRYPPVWVSNAVILATAALGLFFNALTNYELAAAGRTFSPFDAFKLIPLFVAIVVPYPTAVAYALIGICIVAPPALFFFVFPSASYGLFPAQEPWVSVIYPVFALLMPRHRIKAMHVERELERTKQERRQVEDLTRIFLSIRDLANTPLQTIEIARHMLDTGHLPPKAAVGYLERALMQLRELTGILADHGHQIDSQPTDRGFDSAAVLRAKIDEVLRRGPSGPHA